MKSLIKIIKEDKDARLFFIVYIIIVPLGIAGVIYLSSIVSCK